LYKCARDALCSTMAGQPEASDDGGIALLARCADTEPGCPTINNGQSWAARVPSQGQIAHRRVTFGAWIRAASAYQQPTDLPPNAIAVNGNTRNVEAF